MRAAFGEMGVSVLSGMATSIGASIFLFLCDVQFFMKFGVFLCTTIAFSWLYANFFFPVLVATFGLGRPLPLFGVSESPPEETPSVNGTAGQTRPAAEASFSPARQVELGHVLQNKK